MQQPATPNVVADGLVTVEALTPAARRQHGQAFEETRSKLADLQREAVRMAGAGSPGFSPSGPSPGRVAAARRLHAAVVEAGGPFARVLLALNPGEKSAFDANTTASHLFFNLSAVRKRISEAIGTPGDAVVAFDQAFDGLRTEL